MDNNPIYIPDGRYLSVTQVAARRGVPRQTVLHWIQRGWLPMLRFGNQYMINEKALVGFEPPRPGPVAGEKEKT